MIFVKISKFEVLRKHAIIIVPLTDVMMPDGYTGSCAGSYAYIYCDELDHASLTGAITRMDLTTENVHVSVNWNSMITEAY